MTLSNSGCPSGCGGYPYGAGGFRTVNTYSYGVYKAEMTLPTSTQTFGYMWVR